MEVSCGGSCAEAERLWRVSRPDLVVLDLIVAARIDRDGLAWADKTDSRFHPLAFVEFVTNTLGCFRLVLADMRIDPQALQVEVRLGNLFRDSTGTSLPAGPINNVGWTFGSKPCD